MIVSYLSPVDAYYAKICCRKFLETHGSLQDTRKAFDPLEIYQLMAYYEDSNSAELLCVLCLKRHPRTDLPADSIDMPGTTRSCCSTEVAVKLACFRLTQRDLVKHTRSPPDPSGYHCIDVWFYSLNGAPDDHFTLD